MTRWICLLVCLAGCGAQVVPDFDRPVPADEPRETIRLALDLAPGPDCEEAFDLALYRDLGIELVAWDEARSCTGRRVSIRYLPDRIKRNRVLALARGAARRVKEQP